MLSRLINFLQKCWWRSSDSHVHSGSDATGRQDGLLWYKDSGQHLTGDFSMAVAQANNLLEDQSQIETGLLDSGPYGTFVGVYNGHGGPENINDHLFQNLKSRFLDLLVTCILRRSNSTENLYMPSFVFVNLL